MIENFQIASVPRPWQLFALIIFKPISPITQYQDFSVGSFLIWAKLPLSGILFFADDFSQDQVADLELPWVNLLVISSGKMLLVRCELNRSFLPSFF